MSITSMAGPELAEAYLLRKQHKEKMKMKKKKKKQGGDGDGRATGDDEEKISLGCFSWLLHKVHPKTVPEARS
ncbi:hypothetical protein BT93_F0867 [Corymbia citriodora subsp. variegata]|nr:hypothetical protein BT93_F0867 [Corymbia citriodora subsp. variegata]